ncbi:hypothetical protein HPB51_028505 [Rhipicephalus microplus]|uniref:Uncharacterized protein n=1 Tax=Rhipicephalus microplus TaxID=6941 RepID=A0A9J6CWQ0_RHIMP|nr:hypothetical protein HPB51_028505 [Rhipicephalus microplus]
MSVVQECGVVGVVFSVRCCCGGASDAKSLCNATVAPDNGHVHNEKKDDVGGAWHVGLRYQSFTSPAAACFTRPAQKPGAFLRATYVDEGMSGRRAKTLTRRRRSVPASSSALRVSVPPLNHVRNEYAARSTASIATTAWIDEDLDQGDTSDAAAVEGASDQQKLRAMDATLSGQVNSKMQERRDDAPTKGRVSIVLRALSGPTDG